MFTTVALRKCEISGIAPQGYGFAASEKSEAAIEGDELRGDNAGGEMFCLES